MSESLTVLIDMDNVVADFDSEVLKRIGEQYPHISLVSTRPNFYIADDYPAHRGLVRGILNQPGFFHSLPIVEGAPEGLERIIDLGYEPRICTSPIDTNQSSVPEKLKWLSRNFVPIFGTRIVEQAIITRDKYLFEGRALIDDCPEINRADEAIWAHIIFNRPYNQRATGLRLNGWLDEILPEILEMVKL
jgi:5'-nucleotidase